MLKEKNNKNISELKIFKHSFTLLETFMFIGFTTFVCMLSIVLNIYFHSSTTKTTLSAIFPFTVYILYYWTWLRNVSKIDILSQGKGKIYITDEYLREEYDGLGKKIQIIHGMTKITSVFPSTFFFALPYDQFYHWIITFLIALVIAYLFQFVVYIRGYSTINGYKIRRQEIELEAGELIVE